MQTITTIGFDIAKSVFQVHGVDAGGEGPRASVIGNPSHSRRKRDRAGHPA